MLKKRSGPHEDTIREFSVGLGGIEVGPALSGFQGILTGVPHFVGDASTRGPLMAERRD